MLITFNDAVVILTDGLSSHIWVERRSLGKTRAEMRALVELPDDMMIPEAAVARFLKGAIERGLCQCRGFQASEQVRRYIDPALMYDLVIWPGMGKPADPADDPEAIAISAKSIDAVAPLSSDVRFDELRFFKGEIVRLRDRFKEWHDNNGDWGDAFSMPTSDSSPEGAAPLRGIDLKSAFGKWYEEVWLGQQRWRSWLDRKNAPHKSHPNEVEELRAAKEEFNPMVTRDMVRDFRKAYAPEEWKKAGAPVGGRRQ